MRKLFIGMILLGMVIMLGTAGASDTGAEFSRVLVWGSVGIANMVIGFLGIQSVEE